MTILITIDNGIFNLIIDGDTACMDFNPVGTRYPKDLIDSSFIRESKFLFSLQQYRWSPKDVYVEIANRKIFFTWHGNTCEDVVPNDYVQQLEQIVKDLHKEKIYKPSFYPKFFYTDSEGTMHAYAFYSASEYKEQPIEMSFYRPILNPQRAVLVDQLEKDGKLDMGILVKHAFTNYIKWPDDPLPEIYRRVF